MRTQQRYDSETERVGSKSDHSILRRGGSNLRRGWHTFLVRVNSGKGEKGWERLENHHGELLLGFLHGSIDAGWNAVENSCTFDSAAIVWR